ncbi:MAG: hypothetical protein M3R41_01825 [Pseudomonadota bacterium]|nr:hypothetical protein [Pseudomonadota bacterium]
MPFLLLLSAILSALTGVVTGTRVAEPRQVASSSIVAVSRVAAVAAVKAVSRPVVRLASLADVARAPLATLMSATALPAAYEGRRRE